MLYEFETTLHRKNVLVHISTYRVTDDDDEPYIEFEVLDEEGEEIELTDKEVDEFLIEIIEFMEDQFESERGYYDD